MKENFWGCLCVQCHLFLQQMDGEESYHPNTGGVFKGQGDIIWVLFVSNLCNKPFKEGKKINQFRHFSQLRWEYDRNLLWFSTFCIVTGYCIIFLFFFWAKLNFILTLLDPCMSFNRKDDSSWSLSHCLVGLVHVFSICWFNIRPLLQHSRVWGMGTFWDHYVQGNKATACQ